MIQKSFSGVRRTSLCPAGGTGQTSWENRIKEVFEIHFASEKDRNCCSKTLIKSAHEIHSELTVRLLYTDALRRALQFKPKDQQLWGWYPLMRSSLLRVGLLSLYRPFPIPLHDHPGSFGVHKVISGSARFRQYRLASDSESDLTLVSLEQESDQILSKTECLTFTTWSENLHDIQSISHRSVVLSLMGNPYDPKKRSWYYEVPFSRTGNKSLYTRVRQRIAAWETHDRKLNLVNKTSRKPDHFFKKLL